MHRVKLPHGTWLGGLAFVLGKVITGVAGPAPERLGRLVYLDAFVPEDSQALLADLLLL